MVLPEHSQRCLKGGIARDGFALGGVGGRGVQHLGRETFIPTRFNYQKLLKII